MSSDDSDVSGPSPFGDLARPPLAIAALRRALLRDGSSWVSVDVVDSTGSTQVDLAARARSGSAVSGAVLVAEEQTTGHGRLDRSWVSPPRAGLTFSVLLSPTVPVASWGWLPLLTGLAVVEGIAVATGLETSLKWPNDVLDAAGHKLAGILAERVDLAQVPHAVVGIGINVSTRRAELPGETASSLQLSGAEHSDRLPLLTAALRALDVRLAAWEDGVDLAHDYRAACATIGRTVRVELPSHEPLVGVAVDVDPEGRLVVEGADGRTAVAAGDVVHLR
ncbi:MAG TPA: biotin--[acetyl-CoA-carboxylase] ligase [Candidatus Limnocylindria bacterium]|nr:biotin--[acetyl-CoA-carboxylase] ligase [Candidatus Limnocylindria bacterium]